MRKYVLTLFFAFCCLSLMAKADKQTVVLACDLHCQGCCDKIMKNIAFEKGVKDLQCDLANKEVLLTYDAAKTDLPTLLKAFERIGKPATIKARLAPKDDASPRGPKAAKQDTDAVTGASSTE